MLQQCGWCVLVLTTVTAFNFAPDYAKVFSDPHGDPDSLFGYTVALRKTASDLPGILVGAPRGNYYESRTLRTLNRPGNLYWCGLDGTQPCKEHVIDTSVFHNPGGIRGNRSLSFLGGALDVLDSGSEFMTCSPQWRNELTADSSVMNGMCYWSHYDSESRSNSVKKIFTLYELDYQALKDGVETPFYAYGEAGFSLSVKQDGSEILIGAPGVFYWKGAVLRYVVDTEELQKPVPSTIYSESMANDSYFGYSVGYGSFPDSNGTVCVAGAPRASDCKGKVYMFDFVNNSGVWEYKILKEWEGLQLGEYFGSSLAVADFNNDGFDDLLVGAPTHSLKSSTGLQEAVGDEGSVYLFISDQEDGWKVTRKQEMLMGSEKHGARFGTSISLLGDINMDSYPDVAVGAPYEDDSRGAVYIYLGSKDGLNPEYSQKLVAQEINSSLRGFGFSLSRGFDVDENHYNDLAIGAHQSNSIVLVKTYPIITIHPEIIPNVSKIGFSDNGFNASVCISYSGIYAPSKVNVSITVKADPIYKRAHFVDGDKDYHYNVTLDYGKDPYCRNFTIVIEERKEFYKPIDLTVRYKINSQKKREAGAGKDEDFCLECPVLNKTEPRWWKVPYGLGCKQDANCSINLQIKAKFANVKSPFIIGTEEFIAFDVELENKNDPAYMSKISIIFPRSTQLRRIPVECQENGTSEFRRTMIQLLCDVDGPLKQGMKYNMSLELDMKNVPLNMPELMINISAISSDVDDDESNNHVQLVLPLKAELNVVLNGNSVPEQIGFSVKKKDSDEFVIQDKDFTHTYLITNSGPSPVKSLVLDFKVPYGVYMGTKFVELLDISKPMVDGHRQQLSCQMHKDSDLTEDGIVRSVTNRHAAESKDLPSNRTVALDCSLSHVRCFDVHCTSDQQFVGKTAATVSFPIKTKLEASESFLENKDLIIVTTTGSAKLTETKTLEKVIQVTLWRTLPGQGVAWWIVFVAVVGGILILAALIFCLYKFGFFKRDKQMQLQAMKNNAQVENEFLCENSDM